MLATPVSPGYRRILDALAAERSVLLDGGTGTELSGLGVDDLVSDPGRVRDVHRRYAEAGSDVITTNTWGLTSAVASGANVHWMDMARRAVELARQGDAAVAFSLNG